MKKNKRVAILLHEEDTSPGTSPHLIWTLCDLWRREEIEMIVLRGTSECPEADLLIPHIDLTCLPPEYTAFFEKYPRVANRSLQSIAKRQVSRQLLSAGDSYCGRVIVKTNLNFGGIPEEKLDRRPHPFRPASLFGKILRKCGLKPSTDWKRLHRMKPDDYRVFSSLNEIPREVFDNPMLVVERFLPEYEKGLYHLRIYQFVGDRGYCVRLTSTEPVVKQKNVIHREETFIPPEVETFRKQFGMDFGKLDFVLHEGQVVVLDANRTPGLIKPAEVMHQRASLLAPGIRALLDGPEQMPAPPAGVQPGKRKTQVG